MIAAIDGNARVWHDLLRAQPGARVVGPSVVTGVPFPLCNSVLFPAPDVDVEALIVEGVPQLWWLGMEPEPVRMRLRATGLVVDEESMPGMVLEDLDALPPAVAGGDLSVRRVADAARLADFASVFGPGYGFPAEARESVIAGFAAYGFAGDVQHVVGRAEDGRPVACASIALRDGVVGLYDVAVLPDARRRGFGERITVCALRLGARLGAHGAILHSSPSGYGIYERLGFRHVATTHVVQTQD